MDKIAIKALSIVEQIANNMGPLSRFSDTVVSKMAPNISAEAFCVCRYGTCSGGQGDWHCPVGGPGGSASCYYKTACAPLNAAQVCCCHDHWNFNILFCVECCCTNC